MLTPSVFQNILDHFDVAQWSIASADAAALEYKVKSISVFLGTAREQIEYVRKMLLEANGAALAGHREVV